MGDKRHDGQAAGADRSGEAAGPIERARLQERLAAHVVTPGPHPRIHGYDVEGDLAHHYGFAEQMLLTLTGVAPERAVGQAFEVALAFLAPTSVAQAPAHAAVLARLIGPPDVSVVATGAVVLHEQAQDALRRHRALLAWLATPERERPPAPPGDAPTPIDAAAVARLRDALVARGAMIPPALEAQRLTLEGALLLVLHACGLTRPEGLLTAWTLAGLPAVVAEGFAVRPGSFQDYPMTLPPFEYRDPDPAVAP